MAREGQRWLRCGPVPVDRLALGPWPLPSVVYPGPPRGRSGGVTAEFLLALERTVPRPAVWEVQRRLPARTAWWPGHRQPVPGVSSCHTQLPLTLAAWWPCWDGDGGVALARRGHCSFEFWSQSARGFQLWFQTHLGASFGTCPFTPCCGPHWGHAACVCWESFLSTRKCRRGGSSAADGWGWSSARLVSGDIRLWLAAPPGPVRQQRTP